MSSTTDRRRAQEGQVLVLFAGGLITLLLFAALAFDGGMVLAEHRDQQDAADASALAGARYLDEPRDETAAFGSAYNVASANGYTDGLEGESVDVNIPPESGPNAGDPDFIEVIISSVEPSLFARVIGLLDWDVGARAVAANGSGGGGPFSMLALDPTGCAALKITGQGQVEAAGNVQVNSDCEEQPGAMQVSGDGFIEVTAEDSSCNIVGEYYEPNNAVVDCDVNTGISALTDLLGGLPAPELRGYPAPPDHLGGTLPSGDTVPANGIPKGCQGTESPVDPSAWYPAATWDEPAKCEFDGSYAGTTWRLYPGYYPGGIKLLAGTFYVEPGIYYIGGGGVQFGGNGATVVSVASGGSSLDFGILLYNTEAQDDLGDPSISTDDVLVHDWCQMKWANGFNDPDYNPAPSIIPSDDPTTGWNETQRWFEFRCLDVIRLNGSGAPLNLYPLKLPVTGTCADTPVPDSCFNGLVIYQNRFLNMPGDDVILNGADSDLEVRGTIYVPSGDVRANGNGGDITVDQVIAYRFTFSGNGGQINVLNDQDFVFQLTNVGLVE